MSEKYGKKGFTLIELAVILAVVGAVAAVLAPTYLNYVRRSRAILTLATVKDALGSMEKDTGRWPGGAVPRLRPKNIPQASGSRVYEDLTAPGVGIFNNDGGSFAADPKWKGPYLPASYLDESTGKFLDPWGTPYFMDYGYNVNGKWFVVLGSAGPDRAGVRTGDTDNVYVIVGE